MPDSQQDWRFAPGVGRVNDKSRTVWVPQVGWVRPDGWIYNNGQSLRVESLPDGQKSAAQKAVTAGKSLFGESSSTNPNQGGAYQVPPLPKDSLHPLLTAGSGGYQPPGAGIQPAKPTPQPVAPAPTSAMPAFSDFTQALGLA